VGARLKVGRAANCGVSRLFFAGPWFAGVPRWTLEQSTVPYQIGTSAAGTSPVLRGFSFLQDGTHVWEPKEIDMSDPRYTDPRLSDPVLRRDGRSGGMWGWIAGIAVLALIAFVVIAGWNGSQNTASNNGSPPATTGQTTPGASPPSTTGAGGTSPTAPAPANRGQ
jgi:hypothetical protein